MLCPVANDSFRPAWATIAGEMSNIRLGRTWCDLLNMVAAHSGRGASTFSGIAAFASTVHTTLTTPLHHIASQLNHTEHYATNDSLSMGQYPAELSPRTLNESVLRVIQDSQPSPLAASMAVFIAFADTPLTPPSSSIRFPWVVQPGIAQMDSRNADGR